jgi:hypothetical protein
LDVQDSSKLNKGMHQNALISALDVGDRHPRRWRREQAGELFLRDACLVSLVANATSDVRVKWFNLRSHEHRMAQKKIRVKRYLRQY